LKVNKNNKKQIFKINHIFTLEVVTKMQLVVFDLDTALCQTSAMDGLAMASAIKDVANCQLEPESIQSIHDPKALWYRATRRVADVSELTELRDRFSFHLRRQFLIRPSIVSANYSLVEHVNSLQNKQKTIVGLVSSSSNSVLLLKARAIGLMNDALPVSTADDSDTLEGILRVIQTRVKRSYGFHFGESTLVAGEHWKTAASGTKIEHICPSEYLVDKFSAPVRESLYSKASSKFSWIQ
jgi:hypothetical protein